MVNLSSYLSNNETHDMKDNGMAQIIMTASATYRELDRWLTDNKINKVFLVCGRSFSMLRINDYFDHVTERLGTEVIRFSDYCPNPLYESVVKGTELFRRENCQAIIAVGGGSGIDVAKCIKLFSNMEPDDGTKRRNYLKQAIIPNEIPLLAVPTTAGTGTEATRYAVIYYNGEKQSVADESIVPTAVLMDSSALKYLPIHQKKCTMMDAFSHALESFWSVNSTNQSKQYSGKAIRSILKYREGYFSNDEVANAEMLIAANTAGRAINITQTTAGHAMCYKLTSMYGIPHGQAAAMVNVKLFPWMIRNIKKCTDPRGEAYLNKVFMEIANTLKCNSPTDACDLLQEFYDSLNLEKPETKEEDYSILKTSVNPIRLRNNPIGLDTETIDLLYHEILA